MKILSISNKKPDIQIKAQGQTKKKKKGIYSIKL